VSPRHGTGTIRSVLQGLRVIDVDSHVMEPDDLWERYLDKRFVDRAPKSRRITPDHPYFAEFEFAGVKRSGVVDMSTIHFVPDGHGGREPVTETYAPWIEAGFSARSYLDYMDAAGIDHMLVYPTIGLPLTALPDLDADLAAAVKRAYNSWLADFCADGDGRIHGVGALDLRDVDLAIAEATRCVHDLGFRSVYVLPDPPVRGVPLDHASFDPLWSAISELGVPLGTHEGIMHSNGNVGYVGAAQLAGSTIPFAGLAASFGFGEMLAALLFTGSICPRHPDLRVVFTESTVGWAPSWLHFLDEKWEAASLMGHPVAECAPSHYFARQCFISGDGGDPGYRVAADAGFGGSLLAASDFPHPESPDFPHALDNFFGETGLSHDQLRAIFWDNPARLYGFE